jgi:hypothetical protein
MRFLPTLSLLLWLTCADAQVNENTIRLLIQTSPLAGSQYYAVGTFWQRLQVGDELTLLREPGNRHDARAIRVDWQGHQLGYLPRAQNRAVADAMDRGDRLVARIARLTEHPDPWRRVVLEVYAVL